MFERRERVVELLKQELSSLIRTLKDPALSGLLTITDLELSRDMKKARVFYSILGTEEQKKAAAKIFERSIGYLYHRLKSRLAMKTIPFLEFEYDRTPEKANRIEQIIEIIHKEEGSSDHPSS